MEPLKVINKLFLALQNVRFYPPTHSLVQESATEFYDILQQEMEGKDEFSFGFVEKNLIVDGQTSAAEQAQTEGMARQFESLHIDHVTFQAGVTPDELRSFLECLALKPDQAAHEGGIQHLLQSRGIQRIQVSAALYGRIGQDEPKDKKKDEKKEEKKAGRPAMPAADEDFVKSLRKAGQYIPSGGLAAEAQHPGEAALGAERQDGMPSPEELKELYAIRDRYRAEIKQLREIVSRRENENKRLAYEKGRMDAVMRNVGEGVIVVGNDGKILMANPAAEKLLGQNGEKVMGQALKDKLHDEHALVLSRDSPESVAEIEVEGKNKETHRILRASNAVVEDKDGKTIGMVSVLSDITKMKEMEQLKSDFVANVSHELRSPLAAIQKNITVILDKTAGNINENQKIFLSLARDNLQRLTNMINDLLDLSKIEAGKMELHKTRSDLVPVIRKTVLAFTGWFCEKEVNARLELPDKPLELEFDADKIIQVLNNLLSNALKFTPPKGTITISVKVANPVEVAVADTGIGIEAHDFQRIFSKFEQVSHKQLNGAVGTGLGLALAKEIVAKHGGKISVTSQVGKGSTFVFTLPC
jgi:PAS domain S-box-containing protein